MYVQNCQNKCNKTHKRRNKRRSRGNEGLGRGEWSGNDVNIVFMYEIIKKIKFKIMLKN